MGCHFVELAKNFLLFHDIKFVILELTDVFSFYLPEQSLQKLFLLLFGHFEHFCCFSIYFFQAFTLLDEIRVSLRKWIRFPMRAIIFNNFDNFSIQNTSVLSRVYHKEYAFMFLSWIEGLKDIFIVNIIDKNYPLRNSIKRSLNCEQALLVVDDDCSHFKVTKSKYWGVLAVLVKCWFYREESITILLFTSFYNS